MVATALLSFLVVRHPFLADIDNGPSIRQGEQPCLTPRTSDEGDGAVRVR
jgi:hypothetical protein